MVTWLIVFTVMFALDVVWAKYTHAVTEKHPRRAAVYAAALIICNGFVTIEWVTNHWLLIPTAAGAYCGTFWAVNRL